MIIFFEITLGVICIGLAVYSGRKLHSNIQQCLIYKEHLKRAQSELNATIEENTSLLKENTKLTQKKEELTEHINTLSVSASRTAEDFYQGYMNLTEERIEKAMDQISSNLMDAENEAHQVYLDLLAQLAKESANKRKELQTVTQTLEQFKNKVSICIEKHKEDEKEKDKEKFYKLQLPEDDISEIQRLRAVAKLLRNPEPLYKVIWRIYYKKPYDALINRVIGNNKRVCGIYKITNLENEMCYIGQSVNIAERWGQHIKRGIGAEPVTRNKLYPAMFATGVENFSYEILEECSPSELDKTEKFWIDFYQSTNYGYNVTKGANI